LYAKITSAAELKKAILILEAKHADNSQQLKEQFHLVVESFKPVNLFKKTVIGLPTSSFMIDNVFVPLVGLASGFLSKKIIVGSSGNVFRKLIGIALQTSVSNLVAQNPEVIKSIGQTIFHYLFRRKEDKSEKV
jgi:hypothetical protein